ncbi:MAG TPA: LPXTG cell wall anchor domain-containing protein, partial [Candidatus Saccharimonadales bacterium]|nr:LPXTG cell wall anchor domain-containing protein [Candidatus Saccharimonadales bacterium]
GQGGGAGSPAAGSASNVSSLPETGSNTAVDTAIAGVVGLAGVLAASRVGLAAYRRHALK